MSELSGLRGRIGLFGGSFDPIHRGHVEPVLEARASLRLDAVLYLPTGRPPHKRGPRHLSIRQRWLLVELALLDYPDLVVSAYELDETRASYTVDTVEQFQSRSPAAQFFLFMGSDSFRELDQWHRWRDLVQLVELVVLARPGFALEDPGLSSELARLASSGRVHRVENRLWNLSSTALRQRFVDGRLPTSAEIPPLVLRYCEKYALYR